MTNRQLYLSYVAQTIATPLALEIEKAEGIYLYGPEGEKYIDAISGISVSNVGHCHPHVVKAIHEQAAKYMHLMVYGEYIYTPQVKLCEKLVRLLPANLNNVYLVNSGTEATEGAIKLVKKYTGRSKLISFHKSYHGSTNGALSLMGDEYFKEMYRPLLPDTRQLNYGKMEDLSFIDERTAAVFFEPIQAESGINIPSKEYVHALRKKCDEVGALLVFDEIQTGFGRTGSMFAFQSLGVVPDILLLAKGMGGGLPIGAFIADKKLMSVFMDNPILGHITTFGGNAVTAAASLACIEVLENEKLIEQVEGKGLLFEKYLPVNKVKAFRRKGLMMTLEFDSFDMNKKIIDVCIKKGLITDWFLFAPQCLRIGPPLIIQEAEIIQICNIIAQAIAVCI
ncbi:MAG: aminotransferase class III-fold pyridoxal phosphate-dependent enzyme [Bacteroidota bacterium]